MQYGCGTRAKVKDRVVGHSPAFKYLISGVVTEISPGGKICVMYLRPSASPDQKSPDSPRRVSLLTAHGILIDATEEWFDADDLRALDVIG
jgi:hypothetical protein